METLDKCFENVCELDLIFHMDKVHFILNELVMGGMVLETNMNEILTRIEEQNKLEKEEVTYKNSIYVCGEHYNDLLHCIRIPLLGTMGNVAFYHLSLSLFPSIE